MTHPGSCRLASPWARRIIGALIIVLQAGVVSSAVWEPIATGPHGTHIEAEQRSHVELHREDSCQVCSLRHLQSPTPVATTTVAVQPERLPDAGRAQEAGRAPRVSTYASRAPPALA